MLKLSSSPTFLKEYQNYEKFINNINDLTSKQKGRKLLLELKQEASIIDQAHDPKNSKSIDPRNVRDNISKMAGIRYKLTRLIQDAK